MAELTFNLYRLLLEEAREARRARRELSNIFLTLNLAGVGALGFLARGETGLHPGLFAWCAVALILTCMIWRNTNAYYSKMLAAKYKPIYALEQQMGVSPIHDEWQQIRGALKWFTLEKLMPFLFIFGYFVFFFVQGGAGIVEQAWAQAQAFFSDVTGRFTR